MRYPFRIGGGIQDKESDNEIKVEVVVGIEWLVVENVKADERHGICFKDKNLK